MSLEKEYIRKLAELADEMFEFAFNRKTIEKKITDQDIALSQHIIKIQLFDEFTAYQTVYDIYDLFLDVKDVDKNKVLTKETLEKWLFNYVSDQGDWENAVKSVKRKLTEEPKEVLSSDFIVYKALLDFIIYLVSEGVYRSRQEFYRDLKELTKEARQ